MGRELPPEAFESGLDHRLSPKARRVRAMNRRLFREMVRDQIVDRPMSWPKRRALVRFAGRLHIDSFEARLIIRGVEYECGHVAPAAMADVDTPAATEYLLDRQPKRERNFPYLEVVWAVLIAATCLVMWHAG